MRQPNAIVCLALVFMPAAAMAQPDFSGVRAKTGQVLYVWKDGLEVKGRLKRLAPASIELDSITVRPGLDLRIETDRFSKARGVLTGLVLGCVTGGFVTRVKNPGLCVVSGPIGAFWGAIVTEGTNRRITLYDTTSRRSDPEGSR